MFNLFKKKKDKIREVKKIEGSVNGIVYYPIYHNDAISIVHDACVVCVDGKKQRGLEEKVKFIEGKVKIGHESILEHSNYIVKIEFGGTYTNIEALTEIMDCFRYLNVKTKIYKHDKYEDITTDNYSLLIGGSVRGFKHIIRTIYNYNNPIYITILDYIKHTMPSCFFSDLIAQGVFDKSEFMDVYDNEGEDVSDIPELYDYKHKDFRAYSNENKDRQGLILYVDPIELIYDRLKGEYSYYELMDFASVNTIFKDVSRACSHQLVRHRAGITQLSQRYVCMEDAKMILPQGFNKVQFAKCQQFFNDSNALYKSLINDGIKREDARYILPNACVTTLYMTFTFRNFIKAYQLRTGTGAQQEIKDCFKELFSKDKYTQYIQSIEGLELFDYIEPRYTYEAIIASKSAIKGETE